MANTMGNKNIGEKIIQTMVVCPLQEGKKSTNWTYTCAFLDKVSNQTAVWLTNETVVWSKWGLNTSSNATHTVCTCAHLSTVSLLKTIFEFLEEFGITKPGEEEVRH